MYISDPLPAFDNQIHYSKRKKVAKIIFIILLILGAAGAVIYLTLIKKIFNSNNNNNNNNNIGGNTNSQDDPYGQTNSSPFGDENADGYSRGFMLPDNADAVIKELYPYTPAAPLVAALPAVVDWRKNPNVVGPIRSQGGCGACWAFGAVDNMAMAYGMKYGKSIVLSPQQLVDCDLSNGGCGGGWPLTAWNKYFKPNNHAWGLQESQYPYYFSTPKGLTRGTCTAKEENGPVMVTSSLNVQNAKTWSQSAEDAVMAYVAANGPVTVAINADGWGYYKGGIATSASLKCSQSVNHATMIVGFGTENGQNYWIVRNQWGSSWGEGGYIRLARGDNTCCILCYVMGVQVATTIKPVVPQVTSLGPSLNNGVTLNMGQELTSIDGTRRLKLQTDGNLVLFKNGVSVWSTNTYGSMSGLKMQNDCNLVLYNSQNGPVWASYTGGFQVGSSCDSAYLTLQNDGNLIIYNNNNVLWATNTFDAPPTTAIPTTAIPTTGTPTTAIPTTDTPTTDIPTTNSPATLPPTLAPTEAKLYIYPLGCWSDSAAKRALPYKLSVSLNSQMSDCAVLAYKAGFKYFGLQYGGDCWAGDGSSYNIYGGSNQCEFSCVSNAAEFCGGAMVTTTYQLVDKSSDPGVIIIDKPAASLDLPGQCTYYNSIASFCWRCVDNIKNKIVCQDATSSSKLPDTRNLFVADSLCPDLTGTSITAKDICS